MSEIQRYKLVLNYFSGNRTVEKSGDGDLVKYSAHLETTKELEELQDAIANHSTQIEFNGDPNSYYFEGIYQETDTGSDKIIYNAIQASNNRRKNNEQL